MRPTPPPAECTNTRSPSRTRPMISIIIQAVAPPTGMLAAVTASSPSGRMAACIAGTHTFEL